jgi:hypothetical protein
VDARERSCLDLVKGCVSAARAVDGMADVGPSGGR